MTSKEKVLCSLNHENEGTIPVDFDATNVSGMHCSCIAALRDYYGLEKRPVKVREPYQMLGLIEDDLKECIGIDTVGVDSRFNLLGVDCENWKEWRTPQGQDVLIPEKLNLYETETDVYAYPKGNVNVSPSAKMPKSSYFFDAIIRQPEFDEDDLSPDDNLEEFTLYTDDDVEYYRKKVTEAYKSGKAVVASFGGTALGDIACVPGTFLENPKGIRDIEEWYISTVTRTDYLHRIFEKQTETALENLERINKEIGSMVDVAYICGTDFGTQISTFCSEETFRELYMPYYKKINSWIHSNTNWKTFKHSCGAIYEFIPLLIESGFDIINPVQCSAQGMDPKTLKENFGDSIVFWGGGVDTQKILPFGSKEQVRDQVLRRCEIFSRSGGFVFNSIHNVQAKTPVENIVAMIDAVKEFNR